MADGHLKPHSYTDGFDMFRAWLVKELKFHEEALVEHENMLRDLSVLEDEAVLSEKRVVWLGSQSLSQCITDSSSMDTKSSLQRKPCCALEQPTSPLRSSPSQISGTSRFVKIEPTEKSMSSHPSQRSEAVLRLNGQISNIKNQHAITKEYGASFKEHHPLANTAKANLLAIAHHRMFEVVALVAILINALLIACEQQFAGLEMGYEIGFYESSPTEYWASGNVFFEVCEQCMFIFFIAEFVLRLSAAAIEFKSTSGHTISWVIFDALLLAFDASLRLDIFHIGGLRPSVFRMMRLLRMLRLVKLFSRYESFDSLVLLIRSIVASLSALFWSFMLLLLLQILLAIIMGVITERCIKDDSLDDKDRIKLYELYGTFSRGLITNFEISLANWAPICRFLTEAVSEWFTVFFLLYSCMICFAVVRVISAVFIAETNRILLFDEDLGVRMKKRAQKKLQCQFDSILNALANTHNPDGTTEFTKQQLVEALSNDEMQARLGAMDISPHDLDALFDILDDLNPDNGAGVVGSPDFVKGMALVKGPARSLDLMYLRLQMNALMECLPDIIPHETSQSQGLGCAQEEALIKMRSTVHPV